MDGKQFHILSRDNIQWPRGDTYSLWDLRKQDGWGLAMDYGGVWRYHKGGESPIGRFNDTLWSIWLPMMQLEKGTWRNLAVEPLHNGFAARWADYITHTGTVPVE